MCKQGSQVAVGTHKGYVQIWDVAVNKKLTTLEGHGARVGKWLAFSSVHWPHQGHVYGHCLWIQIGLYSGIAVFVAVLAQIFVVVLVQVTLAASPSLSREVCCGFRSCAS